MAVTYNESAGCKTTSGRATTETNTVGADTTNGLRSVSGNPNYFYAVDFIGTDTKATHSFKKGKTSYTGYCCKVRRSSDNTTQDIGFVGDSFDEATYLAFIGAGSGYMHTLYDQSGNDYHITQTTNADQPQIMKVRGHYCLKSTGGDFVSNASFMGAKTNSMISIVWECPITQPSGFRTYQPGGIVDTADSKHIAPWWTTNQGPAYWIFNSSFFYADGNPRLHTFVFANGTQKTYEYSALSRIQNTTANPDWGQLVLGKTSGANGDLYIYECMVWDSIVSMDAITNAHKRNYPGLIPTLSDVVFVDIGDSNTSSNYTNLGYTWQNVAHDDNGSNWWFGHAQGGTTIQNWIDSIAEVTARAQTLENQKIVAVIHLGTNDIATDGLTGAQAFTKLETLVTNLKSGGFDEVMVITMLPRYQSGTGANIAFEANRQVFNDAIVANANGLFDYIVDVETECANIGTNGDQDSTTRYYGDYVHLNATGADELGTAVGIKLGTV